MRKENSAKCHHLYFQFFEEKWVKIEWAQNWPTIQRRETWSAWIIMTVHSEVDKVINVIAKKGGFVLIRAVMAEFNSILWWLMLKPIYEHSFLVHCKRLPLRVALPSTLLSLFHHFSGSTNSSFYWGTSSAQREENNTFLVPFSVRKHSILTFTNDFVLQGKY